MTSTASRLRLDRALTHRRWSARCDPLPSIRRTADTQSQRPRGSPGLPDIESLHELREKCGGWRPVSRSPAVSPRNVPFAASILGVWTVAVRPASLPYWLTAASPIRPSLSLLVGGVGPIFSLPVLLMLWAALRRI